ncbi:ATP-binding protein [Clostridium magnum]|nr:ATP-binding protein [Clostridium magnum]
MGRINAIIQKLREQTAQNGQDINHQSQREEQIQMIQDSSEKDRGNLCVINNSKDKKALQAEKLKISNGECPICEGRGFTIKNSSKYQDTIVFCKCREMDKTRVLWKNSGIETEKNRLTFGNYKIYNRSTEKAKEAAIDYFRNFNNIRSTRKNSIGFLGQVGSGKTHLSIAIGLNLLAKNIPVVYMSYRDEILKLKQNILDEEYYASCLRRYKLAEVLIIDDLFKGKINESDINIIFEIINYRYMNNRPMIVSSEFTAEKLLYFDEGVGSRIIEMCKDYMVEIEGKDNNYRVNS